MNNNIPNTISKYKLTEDSISAVKIIVEKEFEILLKNISLDEKIYKKYQKDLDTYMMKQYPDLSNRLNQMALNLNDSIKKIEEDLKYINRKEKIIIKSDSVYEDIYKIRDEFQEIKKNFEKMSKNLKKAFEL